MGVGVVVVEKIAYHIVRIWCLVSLFSRIRENAQITMSYGSNILKLRGAFLSKIDHVSRFLLFLSAAMSFFLTILGSWNTQLSALSDSVM